MTQRHKMRIWIEMLVALAVAAAGGLCVRMARGQVFNDPAAARANRDWLQQQADAGKPIRLPERGTLYVDGTVRFPHKMACGRIITDAAVGYACDGHGGWMHLQVRVVEVGKGPLFRLGGTGFLAVDPVELVGNGVDPLFEVEGNEFPATGFHRFRNLQLTNAACAFRCLPGFYDDGGTFVKNETHADNCLVEDCWFTDVPTILDNKNIQAVNWRFHGGGVAEWKHSGEVTFAELWRGGHVSWDEAAINVAKFCCFRTHDLACNVGSLRFERFERDRTTAPGNYLTILDYQTPGDPSKDRWQLVVSGAVNTHVAPLSRSKLFKVPAALPRTDWKIEISDVAGEMR